MTLEHGQFGPKGHGWQDLCMGQLDIAKYRSSGSHGFRDDFLKFFPIISLWKFMTHGAWPNGPRDMLAGFMHGTARHCLILNI